MRRLLWLLLRRPREQSISTFEELGPQQWDIHTTIGVTDGVRAAIPLAMLGDEEPDETVNVVVVTTRYGLMGCLL